MRGRNSTLVAGQPLAQCASAVVARLPNETVNHGLHGLVDGVAGKRLTYEDLIH